MISVLRQLLDMFAPRSCAACGHRLSVDEETICTRCSIHLPRTGFSASPTDNEMARLFWARLPIERAAAFYYYHPHSPAARIIYDLKYRGQTDTGRQMGRMAAREMAADGFFDGIDLILPLPLARRRERERGYNQSALIAQGIADITGLPIVHDAVLRIRDTASQTTLDHARRADNMEAAFRLVKPKTIAGRHVLIVDDIVTTGATVTACGKAITEAGDVRISVLAMGYSKA